MWSADNGWRLRIPLPGVAPENVTVMAGADVLEVAAYQVDDEGSVIRYHEWFSLPATVDGDRITATIRHGLLEVALPIRAIEPRRIEIVTAAPTRRQQLAAA
ncbi:MAG TPA: Hsp20/alpha crystallin family protein [Vicinamibacterales bacterium]|nr:Hsp20/alpha crystallin family protein [Vicinamibacterales bacterium]